MLRSTFTLFALVGYASAQLSGTSANCTNALTSIVGNRDAATCVGAASFLGVAGAASQKNVSIVPALGNWFTSLCGAPQCSDNIVTDVIRNLTNGCASQFNLNPDPASVNTLIDTAKKLYPTVRRAVCLRLNDGENCVINFLQSVQDRFGPISIANAWGLIGNVTASGFPANITCTDCSKAIYDEFKNSSDTSIANNLTAPLQSLCGASFVDGATPSNVTQSASDSVESSSSSASSIAFGGVSLLSRGIITGLIVISSLLLLL